MSTLLMDLRLAVRGLLKAPTFAGLVLLTLSVGIGAATAIFSAVNDVMLRPIAVRDPARLVMLWESNEERGWQRVQVAPANAMDWRARARSFQDIALVNDQTRNVSLATGTRIFAVNISEVSGNAFTVLGATPLLGRTFTDDETWADAAPVAVLGHTAWARYFRSDTSIVGQTIRLDGVAFQVAGVLAPSFKYPLTDAEIFTTFRWAAERRASVWFRQAHVVRAIGRLRDGVSVRQASTELTSIAARLEVEYPRTNRGMKAGLSPLQDFLVGDRKFPLLLLLGAVGVLQLIVCANVANLLLARALARRQEMAVRCALGAARGRIARLVLTESLLLALLGGGLGLLVGAFGLDALAALRPAELPDLAFHLDWRVLAFTTGVATISAALFGVQPALVSSRVDVQRQLADGGRTGSLGRRGLFAAHTLTALEVAMAVMLVAGAGLMLRSVGELRRVPSGVNANAVLTFELSPPSGKYTTDEAKTEFAQRVMERMRAVPGVRDVGASRSLPFAGIGWSSDFTIDGWGTGKFGVDVRHREVTPGYFRALEIPLRDGTLFGERVTPGTTYPVVVNQAFAEKFSPNQSLVGRRITFNRVPDSTSYWYEIVGVVGNERMELSAEPQPEIIGHLAADTPSRIRFVVKSDNALGPLSLQMLSAVAAVDPEVPVMRMRTMSRVALDALAADRYLMVLLGVFAVVALSLAAIGVYGVAAQSARSRTREIGIRLALGASARHVLATLVSRGSVFVGVGLLAGLIGTFAGGRVLRTLLFRVEPTDPLTLIGVAVLLGIVALSAIAIPARRALDVDPMRVLGTE